MSELFKKGVQVLRIYTAAKDHINGIALYEWIVQRAAQEGMNGATVFRGIGGFCATNPVLTPKLIRLEINQPVVVEIIDLPEKIEKFVLLIDDILPRGLMTLEDVAIRHYGSRKDHSNGGK